ncbi:ATP-binding protein [Nocardia veterana]|uniref:AfsR/SARP family transcriptional regulator n=1 Tax=Nocardia veterana TaxID=132249 RepID=A0A7X6LZV2_9NOCA|nr:BTAD domain-containing putative transcriptional regulator [Nocardia veterana]NKY87658.1 AfsR/SARP family transcriptional regulator [Nocardia veterana]
MLPRSADVGGPACQVGVLGPLEVRSAGGAPVHVGGPLARAFLALLALDVGRVVGRDRVVEALYGGCHPADVVHALQAQASRLRRALRAVSPAKQILRYEAGGYLLEMEPDSIDLHRTTRLADAARRASARGDARGALRLLDDALCLWRGDPLADIADVPFVAGVVAQLSEVRLSMQEDRAEAALRCGEHGSVLAELSELTAAHPLRERLRALLVQALGAAGRRAEALVEFDRARRLLDDELGVDPSAVLTGAYLEVLRAEALETPRPRPLPVPLSNLIGRDEQLTTLVKTVADARLVTVTGPGGVGKTRLAVEAAGRVTTDVCFVDLAAVSEGAQVICAVATAVGVHDTARSRSDCTVRGRADREQTLLASLSGRTLLVVVDNCEHVLAEAAGLVDRILAHCPRVSVLATSRQPLGIVGEVLFAVDPLRVGRPDHRFPHRTGPALRLFADRAAAAQRGFVVDANNVEVVHRICAAVDGLPLAIELAAARLRTLPLERIAARSDDLFDLLAHEDRAGSPRHRSLRAVVEWSWNLLSDDERTMAQRIAAFPAVFDLADAVGGSGLAAAEELLCSLVDKSLVGRCGGRYRMLRVVREFCAEKSTGRGESADPAGAP